MLLRQKKLRKALYPYWNMKVGDVVIYKTPYGTRDGWLKIDEFKGYQFALAKSHQYAMRDAAKKLGAKFETYYGEGFVRITRVA